MSIAHRRLRWTGGLLLLSIGLAGCDLITGNAPEASTIVISPSGITLDAIGATATLSAEVRDQDDRILRDAVVTWSSSDPNVATISPAGLVTAVRNGTAAITAAAGAASGSVNLSVTQLATMLEKVSGDGQLGSAGELLPEPLVLHAHDRLGNPAIGVPVAFQIIEGGGSPTPAQTQTDVQGRASTTWTLGALAGEAQAIRGFLSFSVGQGVNFAATAVPGLPAEIVVVSGDGVAAPLLFTLSDPLAVRVEDR
ncbi:MAG: Ig-like domain-containing protein, partial [Gemmatimonadetes bacterium]|nr:Ig-like domain-containing protein [Gemmatimonadota bacterium]